MNIKKIKIKYKRFFLEYRREKGFALIGGSFMIFLSLLSFIIPGQKEELPFLRIDLSYGLFANYLPMNIVNKFNLLILGIAGIQVSSDEMNSRLWSRIVFGIMGLFTIMGTIPQTQTFFGLFPLFGGEVQKNLFIAIISFYFGFLKKLT